jgi:hypothetical protein
MFEKIVVTIPMYIMHEVQDYDSNFLTTPLLTQLYVSV